MGRYYVIATLIVVAFGSVVFAHRLVAREWELRGRPDPRMTPTRTRALGDGAARPAWSVGAQGPWVLSALPGCFVQLSAKEGPAALLAADVPQPALRIPPGSTLRRGACTVRVRAHDVWVERGADRLRVPAEARLYDGPQGLTLVYERAGRTQVRVYGGGAP